MGEVKVHALQKVDLRVYRGKFIALLGLSGSGQAWFGDQRGSGVFWLDRQALAAAYNREGTFNQVAFGWHQGPAKALTLTDWTVC